MGILCTIPQLCLVYTKGMIADNLLFKMCLCLSALELAMSSYKT